jgi:hypothetical protein
MSTGNMQGTSEPLLRSQSPTPLEYVNPSHDDHHLDPSGPPNSPPIPPDDPNPFDPPANDPGPGDPPDPDDGPGPNEDDGDDSSSSSSTSPNDRFTQALFDLSSSLRELHWSSDPKPEKIKVREPDTFDGSNSKKLRDFLVSCNLHFRDQPQVFASDEKRILFILSYLKGSALSWFEPGLNDPTNSAHWMWNYQAFLGELEGNFGPHDPVGDAEKARIVKYNVDFWELASRVSWNESALHDRYYHGLLLRLCVEVLHGGKPDTLPALRLKAQDADNIYWMQEEESRMESRSSAKIGNPNKKDSNKTHNPQPTYRPPVYHHPAPSISRPSHVIRDKPKNSISNKLGKNGKLTGDERERRMKEGLCLYCGENRHVAHDFPKSKAAKGRSAIVLAPESKAETADPKK